MRVIIVIPVLILLISSQLTWVQTLEHLPNENIKSAQILYDAAMEQIQQAI